MALFVLTGSRNLLKHNVRYCAVVVTFCWQVNCSRSHEAAVLCHYHRLVCPVPTLPIAVCMSARLSVCTVCVSGVDSVTSRHVRMCYWTCDEDGCNNNNSNYYYYYHRTCSEDGCNSARSIHYLLELIRRRKRRLHTAI